MICSRGASLFLTGNKESVLEASLKHFLAIPRQLTCLVAIGLPHQRAQLESFLPQVPIHGASLPAGGACHQNDSFAVVRHAFLLP
jgi:hypothetical protein